MSGFDVVTLRHSKVKAAFTDEQSGFSRFSNSLTNARHKSYLLMKDIDLTEIKTIVYEYSAGDKDGEIELRLDSQAGPVYMSTRFEKTGSWEIKGTAVGTLPAPVNSRHDLYFIMVRRQKPNDDIVNVKSIEFRK
jgi:cytochrome c